MKKILMFIAVSILVFQVAAYGEYVDPLKNPWIFAPEEYWPGTEPIETEGLTLRLKVPYNSDDQMFFDIWQMELAKDRGTNLILHARTIEESDASFVTAKDAIYKTVAVVRGEIEVFFGSCESPYTVRPARLFCLSPELHTSSGPRKMPCLWSIVTVMA